MHPSAAPRPRPARRRPLARTIAVATLMATALGAHTSTPARAEAVPTTAPAAIPAATAPELDGATAGAARYVPVGPCRLADQRSGLGLATVDAHHLRVDLAAAGCAVPTDAVSLMTTMTVVDPVGGGYTVGYATGTTRPFVAQLNHEPGETRANGALVPVGADGTVTLFRSDGVASGAIVLDVVGAFVPSGATDAGRLVTPGTATRLLDTRSGPAPAAGTTLRVPLPDHVPDDATALAVTAVVVDTDRAGYLTFHPAGSPRPVASTLNSDGPGQQRSGATIVPVTDGGFDVFVSMSAHVVVDTTGWFTGPSAAPSTDGLFVAATPQRLADTRPLPSPIHPGGAIEVAVPTPPSGTHGAALTSITMIGSDRTTYVTAHAARVGRGAVSTGNTDAGEVVNQIATTAISPSGLTVFSEGRVDVTVDLFGWFTGAPATPDGSGPASNPMPRQRVLSVGDSSHAGIERNGAFGALRGAAFEVRGESCRRLVRPSCDLRGNGPPPTAIETIRSVPYGSYDVLVVQTGYNDQMPAFAEHVRQVVNTARSVGFRRIVWLTHSREFRSDAGGAGAFQVYAAHNDVIRSVAATSIDVHAVEWGGLVRQRPGYVYPDGIHLRPLGGFALADTISRAVAHVTGAPCPMPEAPGAAPLAPCPDPSGRPAVDPNALYDLGARITPCAIEGPRRETVCRWNVG